MIGQLVLKELQHNSSNNLKWYKKILPLISSLFLLTIFVMLEILVYSLIYKKVQIYEGFNKSLYIILIFIITLGIIISLIPNIIKMFFNDKSEKIIYSTTPITTYDILFSKVIALTIKTFFILLTSIFVIGCCYGYLTKLIFTYYILLFICIFILSIFIVGCGLLLSIPCYYVSLYIKKNKIFTLITTFLMASLIAILYTMTLYLFINLVKDSSLDDIFNSENVLILQKISERLYPITNMVNITIFKDIDLNFVIFFVISLVIFIISLILFRLYLRKYYKSNDSINKYKIPENLNFKIVNPNKAIINKELSLAFSKQDGLFSYLILIILEPFLIYGVISGVNLIFTIGNFNYITTLYPYIFLSVDTILIMLFIAFINMSSSISLEKEKDTLMILKTTPISFKKQMFIKIMVIFSLSMISYLISLIILLSTKQISFISFLFNLLIGGTLILILNFISLFNDLKHKKNNMTYLYGFIYPLIIVILGVITSLFFNKNIQPYIFYTTILLINIIILLTLYLIFNKFINKMFIDYEGGKR